MEPTGFPELKNFMDFAELVNFAELAKIMEKHRTHENFELLEKREDSWPQPTLIHKLGMTSMVLDISIGLLGLATWLYSLPAPAHLLISRT